MEKRYRVKRNEDFQKIFKRGKSMANRQFVVYTLDKRDQQNFRVGLSVGKKLGNAVTRNRIKRLIREALQEVKDQLPQDKDYIIIARFPTAEMSHSEIQKSLFHVLKRAKLIQ
ncbi:ribonuclease P protein component [Priestia filamentosa]|uniref:Ribonuclease P protein component n=1 Tax=Priestia filamentosa TaxID=1402861 RepID=A0A1X7G6L8_9BACI|nr:ribonuclease P protein component [Priestia filamentosa]AKO94903.1 ribonuclease P protein component [Priestia filamentosa]MDT3765248.1 ribonuclease P protein component [Priestia filamentosa]OXS65622.1 ribonuclease P protein component [Priestia filamentosa]RJS65969.1 ribonuclease P protein component [Priestia filamentosa]WCM15826.1 ribonuclease P protein component [Priestia filamentosa]